MRRRLCFVVNNLDIGGPQKGLLALLETLDPDLFQCTVISMQPNGQLRQYIADFATVRDVPTLPYSLQLNRGSILRDVRQLLRHLGLSPLIALLGFLYAALRGRPLNPSRQRIWAAYASHLPLETGNFHGAFSMSPGPATYYLVDCIRSTYKYHWIVGDYSQVPIAREVDLSYFTRTDGALAVSAQCSTIFSQMFPEIDYEPQVFLHRIPWKFYAAQSTGVPPEFDVSASTRKILTVSRLDAGKGIDLALKACAALKERGLKVRWVVLGDGPERAHLETQIAKLGLSDELRLVGFRINVADYLSQADVLVHPSKSEGRSIAVDEAVAMHKPVVVTNYRTATSQVESGRTGLICQFTPQSIAEAVQDILTTYPTFPVAHAHGKELDPNQVFFDMSSDD